MSNETPPINGADPLDGAAVKAANDAALNRFLDRVVDNIEDTFELLEMTEHDVARVTMSLMINSYCRVFKNPVDASTQLEEFVTKAMRGIRHTEASKFILPPGVSQQ